MLRYLRIQAASHARNLAQLMVQHGAFMFIPASFEAAGLPEQAPPAVAALYATQEELLTDDTPAS